MQISSHNKARGFYNSLIDAMGSKYPAMLDTDRKRRVGYLPVWHAFNDRLPLAEVLLERDIMIGVILKKSSSVIKGMPPVMTPYHFSLLKKGALLISVTSLDDETAFDDLLANNVVKKIGDEGVRVRTALR